MGPAFGHGSDSVHPSERPQPQFRFRLQYHHQSLRQSLRSLRDLDDIRLRWDPGPHRLYPRGELGGPGPPSGPAHQARVSHPHPGLRHHQSHRLSMIAAEYSERQIFQQLWACVYRRPIQRVTEIGPTSHSERWFAYWLETPQLGQCFLGGSSHLRCC